MLPELLPRQLGWLHVVRVLSADMRVVDMRPPRVNHKGDKSIGGTLLGRKGVTPNTRADRFGRQRLWKCWWPRLFFLYTPAISGEQGPRHGRDFSDQKTLRIWLAESG